MKDGYMSGSELRQYLHISTRKMKYLLDHDYIPHENTGGTTHKYRIRFQDAEEFKRKTETQKEFLVELTGMFTSRKEHHPKPLPVYTDEDREAFRIWLDKQWRDQPDAIPTLTAAELLGIRVQRIYELRDKKIFRCVHVGNVCYVPKSDVIEYAASYEKLSHTAGEKFLELLDEFRKKRRREKENERRREKRNQEKIQAKTLSE